MTAGGALVLWGATGQARVLADFVADLDYRVVALFDNDPSALSPLPGVPIHHGTGGFERWREKHASLDPACLVAIGGERGRERWEIQRFLDDRGIRPGKALHPAAHVARTADLAAGCQVLAGAVVGAEAKLGEACIVNTSASVDHEAALGRGVHIAPGATLCGSVTVGDFSMVGPGAVVLPKVSIGSDVVVGAGALVTRDLPPGVVAWGTPARVLRDRDRDHR